MRWAEADGREMYTPGDPIVLTTEGEEHLGWIKPRGASITKRWLGFDVESFRIDLDEITLRDPRKHWGHSWMLQLGGALLNAEAGDDSYRWLMPNLNGASAYDLEIGQVLFEALQDLR